jgi:hypothetical protein
MSLAPDDKRMRLGRPTFLFIVAVLGSRSASAWSRDRVAIVIDNRSANGAASTQLAPALADLVRSKEYEPVAADPASAADVVHAVATAGAPPRTAEQIRQSVHADALLVVSVSFFLEPRSRAYGPKASAAFGLRAALIGADGRIMWRNSRASHTFRCGSADEFDEKHRGRRIPPSTVACAVL